MNVWLKLFFLQESYLHSNPLKKSWLCMDYNRNSSLNVSAYLQVCQWWKALLATHSQFLYRLLRSAVLWGSISVLYDWKGEIVCNQNGFRPPGLGICLLSLQMWNVLLGLASLWSRRRARFPGIEKGWCKNCCCVQLWHSSSATFTGPEMWSMVWCSCCICWGGFPFKKSSKD